MKQVSKDAIVLTSRALLKLNNLRRKAVATGGDTAIIDRVIDENRALLIELRK